MSRSGYHCDGDSWELIRWRGAVASAIRGKRGQEMLRELRDALIALPEKKLIASELQSPSGEVCALGALGKRRQIDMTKVDACCYETVAGLFGISEALAREIAYMNDEYFYDTPERRYEAMLGWVESCLKNDKMTTNNLGGGE